jgi:rabenosyn-5
VRTPYKAGFQPKGVWRVRTGEYEELRMKREEGRRGEERRLGRRLEKVRTLGKVFATASPQRCET